MRLYQYTRTHFSHEESLMRRLDYPDTDEHVKQHDDLISQLDEFSQNIAKDNLIKADLEEFISLWFLTHIATFDTKLAAFLNS
jgi:hemerythrin